MTLAEIRDWLKTFNVAENYYIGRLDNKKEKSLGVYDLPRRTAPVMAVGGASCSSYDVKGVSLLLHWNTNAREAETAAHVLWNKIFGVAHVDISESSHAHYIQPLVPAPIAVNTDENGVYEYVIEILIYYRRNEQT